MEYNTERSPLTISEYGRNIQKMLDHALQIENKDERTVMANMIISVMTLINPQVKETIDYKHKLWDHLHIMSNYRLDVHSPYPSPSVPESTPKPQSLNYPEGNTAYPHYGKYVQKMIQKVSQMPDSEAKDLLIEQTAHYLKRAYLTWNRDSVNDELIYDDFATLSQKQLVLKETFRLKQTRDILSQSPAPKHNNGKGKTHKKHSQGGKPANNKYKKNQGR